MLSVRAQSSAADSIIDEALKQSNFIHDMYALDLTEDTVRAEIDNYRPQLLSFIAKHCQSSKNSAVDLVYVSSSCCCIPFN